MSMIADGRSKCGMTLERSDIGSVCGLVIPTQDFLVISKTLYPPKYLFTKSIDAITLCLCDVWSYVNLAHKLEVSERSDT